jgi:hypothetical protein
MSPELLKFNHTISAAGQSNDVWSALCQLSSDIVGHKLFTVMAVDLANGAACRAYSSHPADYPVSGTKPIRFDSWFEIVHKQHRSFVANTIADIAKVFPDHEKIWSLGCGSVVNLPVVIGGQLAATVNMLHEEHYYNPVRVELIERHLTVPAQHACLAAKARV